VPTSPGEETAESIEDVEPEAAPEPEAEVTAEPVAKATEPPMAAAESTSEPAIKPVSAPPKAVAADAMKSTWPPAAESSPAPPEETDIWPPDPPTERAMPAWPPPSEMEEPATPAQVIPSWPESFDPASGAPAPAASAAPADVAPTITPAPDTKRMTPMPPAQDIPVSAPPAAAASSAPVPAPPKPPEPASPAQTGPASRPTWAPGPVAEPATPGPKTESVSPVQVPAWAPRVPLAGETGKPTWFSPKEAIPHATGQPIVQPTPPAPTPAAPIEGGQLPVAQIRKAPASPATPATPAQAAAGKPTWEVVDQPRKSGPHAKADPAPTAEDRSYAEWFAWAKRGGAPASACHAAAQGAFKALASGKDVTTAVQWATAAMSRPPENVSYNRQTYCAWFALANIDLNLDQHRAHLFAGGAVQALDAGQDASAAHAAGLAAAGIK
jgi:hypothetical protein